MRNGRKTKQSAAGTRSDKQPPKKTEHMYKKLLNGKLFLHVSVWRTTPFTPAALCGNQALPFPSTCGVLKIAVSFGADLNSAILSYG